VTLRQKFVAAFAAIAAFVAGTIGWAAYGTAERALHNEINLSLASAASTLATGGSLSTTSLTGTTRSGGDEHYDSPDTIVETAQSVSANGDATHLSSVSVTSPVSPQALGQDYLPGADPSR